MLRVNQLTGFGGGRGRYVEDANPGVFFYSGVAEPYTFCALSTGYNIIRYNGLGTLTHPENCVYFYNTGTTVPATTDSRGRHYVEDGGYRYTRGDIQQGTYNDGYTYSVAATAAGTEPPEETA